ncbi:MAG: hypothetical protein FJ096_20215 [Deltaproteobacteria bacterium]|nr:hypothetical protein [Deltaproteobacteria bacterium]
MPTKAVPTKAVPTKAVPTKAVPTKAVPTKAVPTKAVPTKAVPTKAVPTKGAASKPAAPKGASKPKAGAKGKENAPASKKGEPSAKSASKAESRKAKLKAIREAAAKADTDDADSDESKRNFGLRGAAPWVARHAAKHAEELRKRNAEPPPPGSARATLRTPKEAEEIKERIGLFHQRVGTINTLRKKLDKSFYEIGELLGELQTTRLFEAKGYATFESFLDREIEIPRPQALKLVRIVHTFDREAAGDYPLERLMNALSALDGELVSAPASQAAASSRTLVGSSRSFPAATLPPKPPIRWD